MNHPKDPLSDQWDEWVAIRSHLPETPNLSPFSDEQLLDYLEAFEDFLAEIEWRLELVQLVDRSAERLDADARATMARGAELTQAVRKATGPLLDEAERRRLR